MTGHIRSRGENSWELKFDLGRDPATGKRASRYHSFKGTKREAQRKLAELIAAASSGSYIEPSKMTVADFVRARVDQWEAAGNIVDIVTISKRLGHAKPSVTLAIYSHMFHTDDRKAGDRDQCSLGRVIGWQSGGNRVAKNHFCSAAIATKLLKDKSWRGGRVAEGGGLLNRYTV